MLLALHDAAKGASPAVVSWSVRDMRERCLRLAHLTISSADFVPSEYVLWTCISISIIAALPFAPRDKSAQ